MRTMQQAVRLGKNDLIAMAHGEAAGHIDDMEFFETLAHSQCLVMPPWVYHISREGQLEQVTPVRYTADYEFDKPSMLLAVMERLPRLANEESVGAH